MRFYDLCSDVNWQAYGGKWYARSPYHGGTEYYVVELINWQDATNEDMSLTGDTYRDYPMAYQGPRHDTERGKARYVVQTTHFDTAWYSEVQLNRALESCGNGETIQSLKHRHDLTRAQRELLVLRAATSYGLGDTSDIRMGNNARKLLTEAKNYVR